MTIRMNAVAYKLRSECQNDINKFMMTAGDRIQSIQITRDRRFPDCEMNFRSLLTLRALRELMGGVEDIHVMTESLNLSVLYTGERWHV